MKNKIQKITTNLWFDSQAEEAAKFYTSIFENSKIGRITSYGNEGNQIHGKTMGSVMTVEFELEGQTFVALNGGPQFKFTEAYHLSSIARIKKNWTIIGENSRKAEMERRKCAVG
ncbi:VOC family protein [Peribacillus simplex]|nr:VOC family protein [Peribacillus simplex]MDW7615812.1 VOC family protein [Peribacillus simplex]